MVYFSCNACGEALKKNQVEKHYMHKCRRCEVLTCVDCHKDFPGDTYATHIKCITEDEKYGGKNYTAKANANKGEKKQTQWIDNLNALVADPNAHIDGDVRDVLDTVMNHENIPRKRAKFINFVKNIRRNVRPAVIEKTWDFFEQALKPKQEEEKKEVKVDKNSNGNGVVEEEDKEEDDKEEETRQGVKMFKGIKEETKKKKKDKKRKKEVEEEPVSAKKSKKDKKRKREADTEEEEEATNGKKAHIEEEVKKFVWEDAIENFLTQKGGAVKLSKVRKYVVKEFLASSAGKDNHRSEEELLAKVEKKATKNKRFKVDGDKVALKAAR